MQERMLAIGGTLTFRSRRGQGVVLRAEVCQPTLGQETPFFFHDKRTHAELDHER